MNLFNRLRGTPQPSSRETAKRRLQLVLVHDRSQISPGLIEIIKDEIIAVISKHVDIDRDGVQVQFTQADRESRLVADIPLLDGRKNRR
jgi:cell division topological specificity factor